VEPVYRTQMAEAFLVALAANDSLPLIVYSFLDDIREAREEDHFALSLTGQASSKHADIYTAADAFNNISEREIIMQKRLGACTKGLLEVSTFKKSPRGVRDTWHNNTVNFLHRTVGEFLKRKEIKARFIKSARPNFDPKISLCHGFLCVIKSIPPVSESYSPGVVFENMIHELLDYAYMCEVATEEAQTAVIDELERYLCSTNPSTKNQKRQSLKLDKRILANSESHSVFELCVQHGLSIYVKHRLELDPSLVSSQQWHRPLLSHAFFPVKLHRSIDPTTMVRLLVEHGAYPNATDGDSTTWRKFVHDMVERPYKSKLELMGLLLANGADPSAGSVLLETLTIVSTSPARVYQMPMFEKLVEYKANPNAKYNDSTVWKRYLIHLMQGKSGLRNRTGLENEFRQVKQLLLSGADPKAIASDHNVDEIIQATFGARHANELLDLVNQMRLRSDGGFLGRVWKVAWRRPAQSTSSEIDG
jgi:hypothetical protein